MANRNQRLDATISIGSVLQKSVAKNIGLLKSGLDSVGDEIKQITDRQRELSKQRRVLEREGRAVDDLDREYEDLNRTLEDLRRQQERLARAQRASAQVGREFGNMSREIGRFARNSAIAVGALGTAVFGIASSTASLGDEVAKQSRALGFAVEDYQELRYAAERSGVSVGTFDSSMVALSKRLGEAAQGTGAAVRGLEMLGLEAEDLIALDPADALDVIADRMAELENPADRAAAAAALFGRAGVRMVNMLTDGSDGLAQLREDARATGNVLSEETTRDAEAFQDALLDAQLSVQGLKNVVGAELMPVVTEAMGDFKTFMVENRDEVEAFAEAFANGLRDAIPVIGEVLKGVGEIATVIGDATAALADFVGGWENFGMIVGGLFAGKLIASVFRFGGSVFRLGRAMAALAAPAVLPVVAAGIRAVGLALVANPIGATITAIALGAGVLISNWSRIREALAPVFEWLGSRFDWILEKLQPVLDALRWVADRGLDTAEAIGNFLEGPDYRELPQSRGQMRERAIGGALSANRPTLVGERGPEVIFPSQAGFVAHNRALQRMADLSRAGMAAGSGVAQRVANVTQNVTINAQGMDVQQLVDELDRRRRDAENDALFDGAAGWGQYGGAAYG